MALYEAQAALCGVARYPNLRGTVHFYSRDCGTVVQLCISGLPKICGISFHGFYIEEGGCAPLRIRGGGIMPPVLNANGQAVVTFFTTGFRPEDIIGRRVVLSQNAECFERGNGAAIACGTVAPCGCMPSGWPGSDCGKGHRPPWEDGCPSWPGSRPPWPPLPPHGAPPWQDNCCPSMPPLYPMPRH